MKIKITLCALLLITGLYTRSQNYVTIPDANFVAFLNAVFPSCMNGNQMDTTCSDIINRVNIDLQNAHIADLTGIQYFTNLKGLYCYHNELTNIPVLPNSLIELACNDNHLTILPVLPNTLEFLGCYDNQLTSLPALPNSIESLICSNNHLTSLPTLPNSLKNLRCHINQITSLPVLPIFLKSLLCYRNQLTSLPTLPNSIEELGCFDNQLTSLPVLPNSIQVLNCSFNQLTSLPVLPASMSNLLCESNQLTSLPVLPDSLKSLTCSNNPLLSLPTLPNSLLTLYCSNNQLVSLPSLPATIYDLRCSHNQLTSLPVLSDSLEYLYCDSNQLINLQALPNQLGYLFCDYNQLTSLPALPNLLFYLHCNNNQLVNLPVLPNSLGYLSCVNNQLTTLPDLPDSLGLLYCNNNNINCFPVFPNTIYMNYYFNIDSNAFTCLPNYISAMNAATLAYPLCVQGDSINNPIGCEGVNGISGHIYIDNNTNCLKDTGEIGLINIPVKLYDNNNNLVSQMISFSSGVYNFELPADTYSVVIDTTAMPFTAQCPNPGVDSTVTTTIANSLATDVNFALVCKPGFDIGVQSVVRTGWVFPGQQHMLSVVAGGMGQWYNLNCGAGVSGQVIITVTGPVTYFSPATGALTPSVSGNVFTYTIADFDSVNITHDFGLKFTTNTSAQVGDTICVTVTVTPTSGDNNISNNTYYYCYNVVNSMDPNMKEVYPVNVLPGYDGYFTYTIHFQNTGTAPAFNIRLVDTLSNKLDPETFKVINYSHNNIASLIGNVLTFRFPNIMLPDSTTDEPGSKGFVQYKIKPIGNIAAGSDIENTAYIYFDYNAPIATNTTVNEFNMLSIEDNINSFQLSIYPNPVKDNATLIFSSPKAKHIQISVYDMIGQEMLLLNHSVDAESNNIQINTQALAKGFYLLNVSDESGEVRVVKFVK